VIRHTAHEIQHHRYDIINVLAQVEPPIIPAKTSRNLRR
jgi:hypothetical protein